jgi:hypothetical protein
LICQGRYETLQAAMTLKVGQDEIAFAIILLEITLLGKVSPAS